MASQTGAAAGASPSSRERAAASGSGLHDALASEGAAVALVARTSEPRPDLPGTLQETLSIIEAEGGRAVAVQTDLTHPPDRARIVEQVEQQLGPVDILVNNAGPAFYEPAQSISDKRTRLSFELNVLGPFELMQRVLPGMRERGAGWILNISSATARPPSGPPYREFDPRLLADARAARLGRPRPPSARADPRGPLGRAARAPARRNPGCARRARHVRRDRRRAP